MATNYKSGAYYGLESGGASLYPGITADANVLRWQFIRKVYGISSTPMILAAAVASVVLFSTPVKDFFVNNPFWLIEIALLPLVLMYPLYYYHRSHPLNLVLLGFFTVGVSLTVGISCAFTDGMIVLEALLVTTTVVLSLAAYTYWASRNGHDFNFLGPFVFVSVFVLVVFGLIQIFFPLGPLSTAIYGGLGSLIFSIHIVYDIDNLIKRYTYDEYIWASVALYFDVIYLFIRQLLKSLKGDDD